MSRNTSERRSAGPLAELLDALAEAVRRRREIDWKHAATATAALDAARADQAAIDPGPIRERIRAVARHAGLSDLETRLLTVAFAAEFDPNVHLLTGLLSGDDGPARPTVAVAMELAGCSPLEADARVSLGQLAALRRHRLIRLDGDSVLTARRVAMDDRVAAHLAGDDIPAAAILRLITDPAPLDLDGTDAVAGALRAGHLLVWVHTPSGAAGTALAAGACRELEIPCLQADLRRLAPEGAAVSGATEPGPAAIRDAVDALATEALLTGSVLILAGAELAAPITDRFLHPALPIIAVGAVPWDPAWPPFDLPESVTAPRTTIGAREALWRPVLDGAEPDPQIAALRLTPEEIARVARLSQGAAEITGQGVDADVIRRAARRLGRNRSSKFATSTGPATLDDLVLPDHTLSEVERLLDWARYRDEVLAQGPLQGKGGKGTGICALFAGGPGTGKSLAAHVVADTLGMDLYSVDISSMVDKYIGETEKNLERVFTEAESLNAVLFFDEADSLFGSRSEVRDAHDRYANQEVAYLLQRMEQFDGITVLATNLRGNLDPAFSRRLHFVIHFPDPDEATRQHLWEYHLSHLSGTDRHDPVDVAGLAHALEIAGGEIRNIVLSAAYHAAADRRAVGMRHLVAAVGREYTKLGRRVPAADSLLSHR